MANNVNLAFPSAYYQQFFDKNGKPLAGGKLYTYIAGSRTSVVTYKTISGGTESANRNTNPIILDMAGMADLVISTDTAYRFILCDRNDTKIDEWDNVTAGGNGGGGSSEDIVVEGTTNEIDVSASVTQGVKHYVISLSNSIKSTILFLIGLYQNVINSLANKADKVQGATIGNLAALDVNGNLTDSGSKVSDFKTKQTAVPDPSASGTCLEFISSLSQNANGEITPNKKSVQNGTISQKGVVQLQDSIGSTESTTDKAVTPHAVREAINSAVASAYHAAGTKTVAQLTSSLLIAVNEGCVYNVTDSGTTTADFVDGAGHPINAGDNVGVCDVGGGVYKFDLLSGFVDLSNYLTKTGDGKDVTSTLTKASGDTSSLTSGSKLSVLFTAISTFFGTLKALAFKDNVSDSDIFGTISDSHIASASTWNGKQNALPTTGTPTNTYAINVSGSAYNLPYGYASWNGTNSRGDKKVVQISPDDFNYNDVMVTLDIYESVAFVGDMYRGKLMIDLRRNADPAYGYIASYVGKPLLYSTMYVKYDPSSHNVYVIFNKDNDKYMGVKAVVVSAQGYQGTSSMSKVTLYNNPDIETTTQYTNVSITFNYICLVQSNVGSTRLPIFANADGSFSTINIDEYYCWAQPTAQWTDVMEVDVYNVQNQCNNEIIGSVRRLNLNSTHPSLCYINVRLPELTGAGRYRFTLEFEITNSSGNTGTEVYGVLILVPPTGYSGEPFLAECVYDSSGKAQSRVMNTFHVPPQGYTYRHKLYVDGHTYRVVKTM